MDQVTPRVVVAEQRFAKGATGRLGLDSALCRTSRQLAAIFQVNWDASLSAVDQRRASVGG